MAGFIKKVNPTTKIIFLGRTYTKDVIEVCEFVDEFINYDEIEKLSLAQQKSFFVQYNINYFIHVLPNKRIAQLAKAIKIKYRIGTTNRFYHWFTCNSLVKLSRKNSQLHESQLNLKLLSFLGAETLVEINQMAALYGFTKLKNLQFDTLKLLDSTKKKIILHPKSKGSAKEWGLENFSKLIHLIPKDKYQIFVSGTKQDAAMMKDFLLSHQDVIDITGKLSLKEFIEFINHCDGIVAASTGPLHIAAALNKISIGLFTSKRPMHPGRWAPIGEHAKALVFDVNCKKCLAGIDCDCIEKIEAQQVLNLL